MNQEERVAAYSAIVKEHDEARREWRQREAVLDRRLKELMDSPGCTHAYPNGAPAVMSDFDPCRPNKWCEFCNYYDRPFADGATTP